MNCDCCGKIVERESLGGPNICPRCDTGNCKRRHLIVKDETIFQVGDLVKTEDGYLGIIEMGSVIQWNLNLGAVQIFLGNGTIYHFTPRNLERILLPNSTASCNFREVLKERF